MKPVKTIRTSTHGDAEFNHPAFGQIRASRVSGNRDGLYDSDFRSRHFINLEITGSTLIRNLSSDWHHARGQKIEVAMTEAQWATFVSSLNMGSGTPCTIERFNGEQIPVIEWEETKNGIFKAEFEDRMKTACSALDRLSKSLDDVPMSAKARKEMKSTLSHITAEIGSNVEFTKDQFNRHMEKTVERAKQEIHGHMTHVAVTAGIETLKLTKGET